MLDSGSTMEIVQLIIGIILMLSAGFVIYRTIYRLIRRSVLTKEELRFDKIRSVYKKLKENTPLEEKLISKFANNIETRTLLFEILEKYDKVDLFPKSLSTLEKISESHLSIWLNMNDDYDSLPDQIEFFAEREIEKNLKVLVFKFRNFEPHLLAKNDWMFGYVGFNINDIKVSQKPKFILSNFSNKELDELELINKFK